MGTVNTTTTTARYIGRSRTHAKTPYLRLQYGDWVQVAKVNETTALVVPMTTTTGVPCDCPAMCHKFTVKLDQLRCS